MDELSQLKKENKHLKVKYARLKVSSVESTNAIIDLTREKQQDYRKIKTLEENQKIADRSHEKELKKERLVSTLLRNEARRLGKWPDQLIKESKDAENISKTRIRDLNTQFRQMGARCRAG